MLKQDSTSRALQTRHVQLLGNGRYSVMLTDAGGGYSHWRDIAISRWREDPTCDDWGSWVLLRDLESGTAWSATRQPLGRDTQIPDAAFAGGRAVFSCDDAIWTTTLEVAVASNCDAEVRRISVHNQTDAARSIELTSYAELVLGPAAADASHPAFAKLFVQTHWEPAAEVLLATRRKRSHKDPDIWAAHCIVGGAQTAAPDTGAEYETDRARFLGRGNSLANAAVLQSDARLSNMVGTVLDPVFSLRKRVQVAAGTTVSIDFWTLAAGSRQDVLAAARAVRSPNAGTRAIADTQAREQDNLGSGSDDCARLLAPLLYADPTWRAAPAVLRRGSGGAPVLWSHGISADRPIALLRVADANGCVAAERLLLAQRRWRGHWLGVDVVLLDAASGDDAKLTHQRLEALQQLQADAIKSDAEGAKAQLFVLRDDEIDADFRDGLATAARVVLLADSTGWKPAAKNADVDDAEQPATLSKPLPLKITPAIDDATDPAPRLENTFGDRLEFDNGIGGFGGDGREYHIVLADGACTPAPWINVVANPDFGFIASAEGGGYTWSCNSQQNPLTPWPNDPVTDAPSEILYLRDLDSGALWSATAAPIRVAGARYRVAHGKGWTRFSHRAHDIDVELLQFVPVADSIKLSRLRLRNCSGRTRRLAVTAYVQWALGPNGATTSPHVMTELDASTGALFARNTWRAEFTQRVAFIDLGGVQASCSGDRGAFLGRFGAIEAPAALSGEPLSCRVGAGLDPCGALQAPLTLEPQQQVDVVFALGDAASRQDAQALVRRYREADLDAVLEEVRGLWSGILDTVQIKTPDRALDIMVNDWLLYQSLGCRIWGRSAYYQSSGAYGFRDQLQDVMSLCVARPDLAREHIVRSAGRQFPEGDVQHWWLPPSGQGIRTRMSDDRLWLPFVAAHYIRTTGDASVLDECTPFLEGDALKDGQDEAFFQPKASNEVASIYEHGARAIDVSLALGAHALPLIGTGDWNDGMNRVGEKGRGESVWLAWLLIATIEAYQEFARARGDEKRLAHWRQHAQALRKTVEAAGWDGDWYRRGYYDDGTPLGSAESQECKIDTIAQSWSAIASASDTSHVARAMQSVQEQLLRPDEGLALLFTPPFDDGPMDPGYIKGYPPGVRENGGQYTHGAIWSVFAFARLGQGDRAGALFSALNPIHHADSPEKLACYRVEPYVACADVYSVAPHVGRGGWTWYTGSGAWLYRAGLEAILGFTLEGDHLLMQPCIPHTWDGFSIVYCHRSARYVIEVSNPQYVQQGIVAAMLDAESVDIDPCRIALRDDGATHRLSLTLGVCQVSQPSQLRSSLEPLDAWSAGRVPR